MDRLLNQVSMKMKNDNFSNWSLKSLYKRGGRRPPGDDFRDIKVEPLSFNGNQNPDGYLVLVQAVDRIFEAKGYDDANSFKITDLKLIRCASLWFENLKKQRAWDGKKRINSWEKLKTHMNRKFIAKSYKQHIYNQIYLNKTTWVWVSTW